MTDAQVPPPPSPPGSAMPTAQGLVQAFVGVLTRTSSFFESLRTQSGLAPPLVFAAAMGLLSGAIHALYAVVGLGAAGGPLGGAFGAVAGFGMIVVAPFLAVIVGSFIGGAIVHVIALLAGGKGSFEHSVRVASYVQAVMPLSAVLAFIPLVRHAPSFYGLYLVALGIIALHLADRRKTFTIAGVLAAVLAVLLVMGVLAGRAAKKAGEEIKARYGEGSEFQKEIQKSAEEMRKAAERMREEAERERRK